MSKQPIKNLVHTLLLAKEQNLIVELANYTMGEIYSYIIVTFTPCTKTDTKYRLAKHITDHYDDVITAKFSATKNRLYVEYDDWETLPKHVAF